MRPDSSLFTAYETTLRTISTIAKRQLSRNIAAADPIPRKAVYNTMPAWSVNVCSIWLMSLFSLELTSPLEALSIRDIGKRTSFAYPSRRSAAMFRFTAVWRQ